jgi:hypothetical protein
VFDEQKQVLSTVGRLAEERPQDAQEGYVAERPDTLNHCIRVWSPCGCCLTYMSAHASVLTQCASKAHDFDWAEAQRALQALQRAEQAEKGGVSAESSNKLAIVKLAPKPGA